MGAERYDAVVIGGGHNGLTAAAYLARAGCSCLVLERSEQTGGAAVSASPFAGVAARISRWSYLVSLLPSRIVDDLELDVRLLRRRIAAYAADPRQEGRRGLVVDSGDSAATAISFRDFTGGESEHAAWERLYGATGKVARAVFPTLLEPLRSRAALRSLVADEDAWELVFERPIGEGLAALLHDDVVRGVAETDALIGTFASTRDADLRANRCFLYHVIGRGTGDWLLPLGGMGAVSGALERAARDAGAQIRTGVEVLALEPAAGGVAVRTSLQQDGAEKELVAGHALVAAAPAELDRLLGRRDGGATPEGSQLKVNMLLSRLPRLRDPAVDPAIAFAGTAHFNESSSQLQRAYEQARAGALPDPVPCETYCHSLSDPSILGVEERAAGVHTLTVFALHMPRSLFVADPDRARDQALAATLRSIDSLLAEPLADLILQAPDGRPCIEAHSPVDIERELRMPAGNIFHGDLRWPFAESEEEVGRWGVETVDPRVLLCGAGARRGGGVSGIAGRNAAMAVIASRSRS